jgi:hypothetical protein
MILVELVEELIALTFSVIAVVIGLLFSGFILLILYGIAVLIFRNAFGVELPNPLDWVPSDWRLKSGL